MNSKAAELLDMLGLQNREDVKVTETDSGFILELPDGCGDMALQELARAMEAAGVARAKYLAQLDEEDKRRMAAEAERVRMTQPGVGDGE